MKVEVKSKTPLKKPTKVNDKVKSDSDNESEEEVKSKIPMKRFGHSTEIAALVNYILSEDSKYTTGQVFHINGGLY